MLVFYLAALETDEERDKLTFLYERYKSRLTKIAMGIVHNAELAEDAVHETFLETIRQKEKILSKSPIDFQKWSVIVVRGKSIDILRRRKHIDESAALSADNADEIPGDGEPLELILTRREEYDLIRKCLLELDPVNRNILWAKYVSGLSYSEIASEMGMTISQVNSRMERTREKLRELLKERGGEQ